MPGDLTTYFVITSLVCLLSSSYGSSIKTKPPQQSESDCKIFRYFIYGSFYILHRAGGWRCKYGNDMCYIFILISVLIGYYTNKPVLHMLR